MFLGGGTTGGHRLMLLVLGQENLDQLAQGGAILLTHAAHGEAIPEGLDVVLVGGANEADVAGRLGRHGIMVHFPGGEEPRRQGPNGQERLSVGVRVEDGRVVVNFGVPRAGLALDPDEAMRLADVLRVKAVEARAEGLS